MVVKLVRVEADIDKKFCQSPMNINAKEMLTSCMQAIIWLLDFNDKFDAFNINIRID